MSIQTIQEEIIGEFAMLPTWEEKYTYIIDLGKNLKPLPEEARLESNKIKGCQSNVWLSQNYVDGLLYFSADSDSAIVKGLVSLLIRVLSGQKPSNIAGANLFMIEEIGMTRHLAQTRSNGLLSMLKQMKFYGLAYAARETQAT
jgi:cysteine desulfuration protein SufE